MSATYCPTTSTRCVALIATARADHAAVVSERNVIISERDALISERNSILIERDQLAARNQRLEAIIAEIRRAHFGRKSERISEDQLAPVLEELETTFAKAEAAEEKTDPGVKTARVASAAAAATKTSITCRTRR
jgi:Transposase C of IS166 homeodomain